MRRIEKAMFDNAMYRTLEPILFYAPPRTQKALRIARSFRAMGAFRSVGLKAALLYISQHLAHA